MSLGLSRTSSRRRVDPVLRRFLALADLSNAEIALVERAAAHPDEHRAGAELLVNGDGLGAPRLILSGWACRQRLLADGRRQIFSFLVPGDAVGLTTAQTPLTQVNTVALTRMETADASCLKAAAEGGGASGLAAVLAQTAVVEERRILDQVVRLGRHTAYERVAHLLLELHDRLALVGLADNRRFPMPITQEALADALGLSIVHINRILQQLRRDRLIEMRAGQVVLLAPQMLAAVTDYAVADGAAA